MARGTERWWLQVPGWLLLAYLVFAQAIPAFDYELGVRMGILDCPADNHGLGVVGIVPGCTRRK